jgi:Flp pilus assembly protein TadG
MKRLLSDSRGATAIEFAIICPLIFATVLGTLESGRALYERNKLSAACLAGVRAVAVHGAEDDDAIRNAIESRFSENELDNLEIEILDETIDGAAFKKLELTYDHSLIIKLGHHVGELQFVVTRYAPAVPIEA